MASSESLYPVFSAALKTPYCPLKIIASSPSP